MDAILSNMVTRLLEAAPYQAWLFPIVLIIAITSLFHRFINWKENQRKDNTAGILAILGNPHCPEASKEILTDYIEAHAFRLATGASVNREDRMTLLAIYKDHRTRINPTDIGIAMENLKVSDGKLKKSAVYFFEMALLWFSYIFLPIATLVFAANIFIKAYNAPTFLLGAQIFVITFIALWTHWTLQTTNRFLSLANQPPSSFDPQVLSDS